MAISATVTPGKVFTETDAITHTTLNQLGTPTVDIAGAVGSLSIDTNTITNAHVQASTGIQLSKLETGSEAQLAIASSLGVATYQSVTGDVEITSAGVTAIGDDKVTTAKILNENVTEAKLIAAVVAKLLPPGVITSYVKSASEPTGWKYCDGGHYDSTDSAYTALFAIIAYQYGRTDSSGDADPAGTYFQVPDLRGRVPVGVDGTAGRLGANDTIAATGGAEAVTLSTDQIPVHSHSNTVANNETTSAVADNSSAEDYGTPWSHDATDVHVNTDVNSDTDETWRMADIWNGGTWDVQPEDPTHGVSYASGDAPRPYLNMRADKDWNHYFEVKNTSNVTISNGDNTTAGNEVSLTQPYQVVEWLIKL